MAAIARAAPAGEELLSAAVDNALLVSSTVTTCPPVDIRCGDPVPGVGRGL
jgi:hypothetical protein